MEEKVVLGDGVQDKITGYSGTCVGIITYLNGCRRIGIQSKALDKGLPVDIYWVDEVTVDVLGNKKRVKSVQKERGGANMRSSNGINPATPKN